MNIGFTYDLRSDYLKQGFTLEQTAEFDKEDTIDAIAGALETLGHTVDRVGNINALVKALAAGKRWDCVFNIAEGYYGISREAQVPALLEAYNIPYTFSDPVVLAATHHKGIAKQLAREGGVATPRSALVTSPADIDSINLRYPLFVKPVAEGTGKGVTNDSRIETTTALKTMCARLLKEFNQPVLVEEFLPGREFTVGIAGNGGDAVVLGVLEVAFNPGVNPIYGYEVKSDFDDVLTYKLIDGALAEKCGDLCLKAHRVLGCRDVSRVDIRLDSAGEPNFMEVNALPGLNPTISDLPIMCRQAGISYLELIRRIMDAFIRRCPDLKK